MSDININWGCFRPITTHRRSISGYISQGREKKNLEMALLFGRTIHRPCDLSLVGDFISPCGEKE
ncbi:hypothetical protein GW17_00035913 [Ensete ventricosum]|nr:hypothetical protein GW17_00035913 [Ensete ventricosum]